ncbi:hypothetical protein [Streptomyces sp. NPDC051569]|uniref:hypothetical protein n=1 Tax=Streptomyces sp. NPDC051569 TaxID=3365661 RepID=UPI0037913EFB
MPGGLLDLLLDRDGGVQQVHVPKLEAEELARAEPCASAQQDQAPVAAGYLLGRRPHLRDRER